MKNLLILIASIIVAFWSCTVPESQNADVAELPSEGEEQIQLVDNYIDALLNKDFSTMESLLSEDYMGIGPAINDSSDRAQTLESWKTNWDSLYTSIDFDRKHKLFTKSADDLDWVCEWAVITLNYIDGSESVTFWWNGVFRVTEGKIDVSILFFDTGDIMAQQGFEFVPPGGESESGE
jgi:limonene-1,2-epoxide hydrolase